MRLIPKLRQKQSSRSLETYVVPEARVFSIRVRRVEREPPVAKAETI